ncbi:hypothetical protein Tco_0004670 [Tanacetum coccineum]
MTTLHDLIAQAMQKKEEEKRIAEEQAAKERYWKIPICDDDDDEDYTIAITPVLSTEEPVNSLIMENEHLDTISATESDEFIKSSVEILVPIPNQSEDFSDSNVDSTSTDEDSFSSNDVEYVEASPPNSEPVSSKVMEIVIPEINSYHPSNRSDFHEEFADELAQIISQPEYDCFFKDEPELGNFTMDVIIPSSEAHFTLMLYGSFSHFFSFPLFHLIFSPLGMKTPYLIPAFQKYHSSKPDVSHRSGTLS